MLRIVCGVLLFLGMTLSAARAADPLTLEQAIELALERNHDVQVARNDRQASRNNVNIGNAGLLPSLDLAASLNYREERAPDSEGGYTSANTQNTAALQARYTLFDGLSNIHSFKSLQKSGHLGELQARAAIEFAVLDVGRAYFRTANAQDQLRIVEEALGISQERYQRAELQAEYGQANTVDVLSAQVDLNNDSTALLGARLALDEARRDLNLLLNRETDFAFEVDTAVSYLTGSSLDAVEAEALGNNAVYLIAVTGLERARLERKIARSDWFPRLDLQMSYGYNKTAGGFSYDYEDPTRTLTTTLSLNFNIFNGFQTRIRNQNATLEVRNRELLMDQARLDLTREVANAFESYQNSLRVLDLQRRNLRSAELNFVRTEELFRLGQVTTTTFREAQLNLVRAKSNISAAKYNAKNDELELLRLSGQLL